MGNAWHAGPSQPKGQTSGTLQASLRAPAAPTAPPARADPDTRPSQAPWGRRADVPDSIPAQFATTDAAHSSLQPDQASTFGSPNVPTPRHLNGSEPYKAVLLFGAPGVGKGTQGAMLALIPGFHHMSTGDMFRNLDRHTELGRIFQDYSNRGELVPDHVTIRLWQQNVDARIVLGRYKPDRDLLILDGIPRTTSQAKLIDGRIDVLAVVHLTTRDPEVMVQRLKARALKEGRADDAKEETIRRRFEVYQAETKPMLEFYPRAIVHEIEAVGSPARVLHDILAVLVPILDTAKPEH